MDAAAAAARTSNYECLLFDMDDTLYPMSSGLNLACRKNIQEFMLHQLHMEESAVPSLCLDLYREHGTTMAGLKALGYEFDDDEFHAYVHGKLPYEQALKPDPFLRTLLLSMPHRKIILTNADKAHAAEVVKRLGLEDCFEAVICFETLNPPLIQDVLECNNNKDKDDNDDHYIYDDEDKNNDFTNPNKAHIVCKPSLEAFEAAIRIANIDPNKTIFFDDSARNIASAKAAGLHTVIVGSPVVVPGADHALSSIHNIKETMPQLWEGELGKQQEQLIQSTSLDQTIVLASQSHINGGISVPCLK
ncbi:uncharacterized protein LOC131156517 [Malania oleifera]|uniref:uncharacterized protein LOC131156517 n=1 Tax=Malania oleifera TaxID=397392 RepID=UPI0025AE269B|nr:uncharacterized protein LOC131156517 [Malania oleifera]XP_057966237.1 uncharacterized protein LOC131156517 [Malania oleifera]